MALHLRLLSTVVILLFTAASTSLVAGWGDFIRQSACDKLHVSHTQQSAVPSGNVTLTLLQNGVRVQRQCFEPDTSYTVELKTTNPEKNFAGLLMRTADLNPNVAGEFLPNVNRQVPLPPQATGQLLKGVCSFEVRPGESRPGESVSHRCDSRSGCNLGNTLNFGYRSSDASDLEHFVLRYTVVFSYHEYLENQEVSFPPCSVLDNKPENTTTEVPTSQAPTKSPCVKKAAHENNLTSNPESDDIQSTQTCGDFEPKSGARPVSGTNCGQVSHRTLDERNHTQNGVTYQCQIDLQSGSKKVRKTQCEPTCILGKEKLCCKAKKSSPRQRTYACSAVAGEQYTQLIGSERILTIALMAVPEKQCICYKCSDVICQAPTESTSCDNDNSV